MSYYNFIQLYKHRILDEFDVRTFSFNFQYKSVTLRELYTRPEPDFFLEYATPHVERSIYDYFHHRSFNPKIDSFRKTDERDIFRHSNNKITTVSLNEIIQRLIL